ncbi:MAG: hypothetical protein FJ387_25150 [Verrucomicrobia bacterium]|nr:hypothetical protein [Verrucomicrobiota bacterium]
MTKVREFLRAFPRFKRQAEAGKTVRVVDRQGRRFAFVAERPAAFLGAGKHLAKGKPLPPERIPADEWKGKE